jgi:hypothetical protein
MNRIDKSARHLCGAAKEKRLLMKQAFGISVGPEFEDPVRSDCRHHWRPLQASRLPTVPIVIARGVFMHACI